MKIGYDYTTLKTSRRVEIAGNGFTISAEYSSNSKPRHLEMEKNYIAIPLILAAADWIKEKGWDK